MIEASKIFSCIENVAEMNLNHTYNKHLMEK